MSAHMMADLQLSGTAESGVGALIAGFHTSTQEFAKKLSELPALDAGISRVAQCEWTGYVMFLVSSSDPAPSLTPKKLAAYRREPHKFFVDLPYFLRRLKARSIEDLALSESYGAMTLTLLYTEAPSQEAVPA